MAGKARVHELAKELGVESKTVLAKLKEMGEFVKSAYEPKGAKWADVYADYVNKTNKVKITATPNLRSLDKYSHPNFPGFPLTTPDVMRAKIFIDELAQWEKAGKMPNLTYLFLPADHTSGTNPNMPTPRAMVRATAST